ncbi:hypothetical protein N8A90_21860 [Variovorax sp. N23]|nr:hypothetical protein [Variovorax sp. N23]
MTTRAPMPRRVPALLGVGGFVLLWLLALALSVHAYLLLAGSRTAGDEARGRLIAQSVAQRVVRAESLGIPLHRLVGMPELLRQRLDAYPDVESIVVNDEMRRQLWRSDPRPDRLLKGRLSLLALPDAVVEEPIALSTGQTGSVRLTMRGPDLASFMASVALPLTLGCAFFAAMGWLAAWAAFVTTRRTRDRAVRLAIRDIDAGRYDRLTITLQRRDFDRRVQQLARGVRAVHETLERARRVVGSLRRTEPHPARRKWLDQLLASAEAGGRFAATTPQLRRLVAGDAQAAWVVSMLATTGGAVLSLAAQGPSVPTPVQTGMGPGAMAAMVWCTGWLAASAGWWSARLARASAWLVVLLGTSILGAGGLALGLHMPDARFLAAGCAGLAMGATLAATEALQQALRQRRDLRESGARPYASLAGWLLGALGLGPALGGLAGALPEGTMRMVAVVLPLALALCMTWRWNVAHSPWQTRLDAAPSRPRTSAVDAWTAIAVGGLGAIPSQFVMTSDLRFPVQAVCAALSFGTGLILGLADPGLSTPRRRRQRQAGGLGVSILAASLAVAAAGTARPVQSLEFAAAGNGVADVAAAAGVAIAMLLLAFALGAGLRRRRCAAADAPIHRAGPRTGRLALMAGAGALLVAVMAQAWPLAQQKLWPDPPRVVPVAGAPGSADRLGEVEHGT